MRTLQYTLVGLMYVTLLAAMAVHAPSVEEAQAGPTAIEGNAENPAEARHESLQLNSDADHLAPQDTLTAEEVDSLRTRARELAEQMRVLREDMQELRREHRALQRQLGEDRVRELERFRLSEEQRDSLRALAEQARERAMHLRERAAELRLSEEQRQAIREARERMREDIEQLREEMHHLREERGDALREYQESLREMQEALREALQDLLHPETARDDS